MKPGRVLLDRYKVLEELGRGYTGTVYLCDDIHLPGKQWALKVVGSKRALRREVEILVSLRHRNLPTVVDNFELEGQQFLVLEFIEGENLADLVAREGPVQEFEALRWSLQISRTLEYLHQSDRPVIFRDLRPERVIITPDRHIKLVDFGLARYHEPGQTRRTVAKGSVGYSPPEQWKQPGKEEPTADIYALGATLFFALTGQPPPPTGKIPWPELAPTAPTRALVERCMRQNPKERFPSADRVTAELESILQRARTPRSRSWVRPLLLLAALMVVGGLALTLWQPPDPGQSQLGPYGELTQTQKQRRERAELLLARGETEEALALLNQAVSEHPDDALAHILKANAYATMTAQSVWRVPVLTSLTGPNSGGYGLLYGLALAQEEINRENSPERALVLDVFDDRSETERAIQLAQRITKNPDYRVCIGTYSSGLLLAVAQLFNAAGMPLLSPTSSDPRAFHAGSSVLTLAEDEDRKLEVLAQHIEQQNSGLCLCLVAGGNLHSRSIGHMFTTHYSGESITTLTYGPTKKERKETVRQVLAQNPSAVFIADYQSGIVSELAGQLRSGGFQGILAVGTAPFSREFIEDSLLTTYWEPDPELSKRFQTQFGPRTTPSLREALAYDSLFFLYQQRQSSHLLQDLKNSTFEGVTGTVSPANSGQNGRPVYLVRAKEGKFLFEPVPAPQTP